MTTDELTLKVNGKVYGGWQSVRVKRSLRAVAGSFDLAVSDRWNAEGQAWQITPGDACSLSIGSDLLITGYVDKVAPSFDRDSRSISVSGRDRAGDLVDCSAKNKPGQWMNITLPKLAQALCKPFGVGVVVDPTAAAAVSGPFVYWRVQPGETVFESLERAARLRGVLLANDGRGNLLITLAGTRRAAGSLEQGVNLLRASADYDHKERFSEVTARAQDASMEDLDPSVALTSSGTAYDSGVTRYRPLIVMAEGGVLPAICVRRARWEVKVRAGKSAKAQVTVQGWRKSDGALWTLNERIHLRAPWLGVDMDFLISGVTLDKGAGGTTSELELERPDAYSVDPTLLQKADIYRQLVLSSSQRKKDGA